MSDTHPDPDNTLAAPHGGGGELAGLRSLLRDVVELLHRGLHELDPHEGEPSTPRPDPDENDAPSGADPDENDVASGGADLDENDVASGGDTPGGESPDDDPGTPVAPGDDPPSPASGSDPSEPDSSHPPTPPTTEPTMPIGTRNFAFAHARIESDGENVRVIKATGFTPAISHPTDPNPVHCAPADDLPRVARVKPEDASELPPNTLLYRLLLPENHQIDRTEAVVTASAVDRETHAHYEVNAWAVNDRVIEVGLEIRRPDVNAEAKEVFALDVLVFRVD